MRIYISLAGLFVVVAAFSMAGAYVSKNNHIAVLGETEENPGIVVNNFPKSNSSSESKNDLFELDTVYANSFNKPDEPPAEAINAKVLNVLAVDKFKDFSVKENEKAIIIDVETNEELLSHNADNLQPIASITKLATALTFIDFNPGWENYYKVKRSDLVAGGKIYIYEGEEISVRDLFHLSLIASANSATKALVASTGIGEEDFVRAMNTKMISLGLNNTKFADPIGFSHFNVSSASEVAKLAKIAFSNPDISRTCGHDSYSFVTRAGRNGKALSTNVLFKSLDNDSYSINCGKTGYTQLAGYCFVGKFEKDGHSIITVYLGGQSHDSRFIRSENMAQWAFDNYLWKYQ